MSAFSIRHFVVAIVFGASANVVGQAQDIAAVSNALSAREEQASAELAEVTRGIEAEKLPLIRERNNLEARVIALRQEVERSKGLRTGRDHLLKSAATSTEARRKEVEYLTGLIADYSRNFESRIHIAEVQRYKSLISDAQIAVENRNLNNHEKIATQLPLISASVDRLEGLLGGDSFDGSVLATDGRLVPGNLVLMGPIALFSGERGAIGTVELVLGSPEPSLIPTSDKQASMIKTLVETGTGSLPVDPSGGNARKLADTKDTLFEQWQKGGPVMIPILCLGFLSVLVGVYKWAQIGRIRQPQSRDVEIIIEHLNARSRAEGTRTR